MAEKEVIDVFQEISALGDGVLRNVKRELAEIYGGTTSPYLDRG